MCFPGPLRSPPIKDLNFCYFFYLLALYSIMEYLEFETMEFQTHCLIPHLAWQVQWAKCNSYFCLDFVVYFAIALLLIPQVIGDLKGNSQFSFAISVISHFIELIDQRLWISEQLQIT